MIFKVPSNLSRSVIDSVILCSDQLGGMSTGVKSRVANLMCGLQSDFSWKKHVSPAIFLHLVYFQECLLKRRNPEIFFQGKSAVN